MVPDKTQRLSLPNVLLEIRRLDGNSIYQDNFAKIKQPAMLLNNASFLGWFICQTSFLLHHCPKL